MYINAKQKPEDSSVIYVNVTTQI